MSNASSKSVDILLLGSGWTSTFLLPLLRKNSISYAYTSRTPPTEEERRAGKIEFELKDPVTKESLLALPSAKTVLIVFPIKSLDQVHDLLELYESLHGATRWIQLGSTGIWGSGRSDSSTPVDRSNPRAAAEQRLLDLAKASTKSKSAVLNLAGLYGNQRQPINFAAKIGAKKEMLALKGSVHFVHGQDVARAVLLLHQSSVKGWGKRWIISDRNLYDWWQLFRFLKPKLPDHPEDSGEIAERWVKELMQENNVHSLPRPFAEKEGQGLPKFLERALNGYEFWDLFDSKPAVKSVYKGAEHNLDGKRKDGEKAGSSRTSFNVREFDPTIPQAQVDALIERLKVDIQRPLPAETEFEGDHERFGLTHARFMELRDAWIPFLKSSPSASSSGSWTSSSSSTLLTSANGDEKATGRPGPDHDSWAADQARIKSFSHFKVEIEDVDLHFIHERANGASLEKGTKIIPLLLLHGWPGSFHEFLDVIKPLAHPGNKVKTHFDVVVPSHPGYVFSSRPRNTCRDSKTGRILGSHSGPNGDFLVSDVARIMDQLMQGLGYQHYAVQAGDWGSHVLRSMACQFPDRVLACHLNFCPAIGPAIKLPLLGRDLTPNWLASLPLQIPKARYGQPSLGLFGSSDSLIAKLGDVGWKTASLASLGGLPGPLSADEKRRLQRGLEFANSGSAYALFHGTRPSTLGLVLSRSPLSTLSWIAEKLYAWTDDDPPISTILAYLSLYEVTETMPRSIYPYRNRHPNGPSAIASDPSYFIKQPTGYSDFPMEIIPTPKRFVEASVNLRWYKKHKKGGHFAAMERPREFVEDVTDCFSTIWPK